MYIEALKNSGFKEEFTYLEPKKIMISIIISSIIIISISSISISSIIIISSSSHGKIIS